ncbi:MAG: c-type cytochrome [Gammaproteobacteria bacterium]|nr:MAG: c-type cytochrome [Gammaproteobacteria bacterium]
MNTSNQLLGPSIRIRHLVILSVLLLLGCTPEVQVADMTAYEKGGDWPVYMGDSGRSHYSELDQITRDNVKDLEVAWVYDSGEMRERGQGCSGVGCSAMYTSPLVVDGVLYGLSPKLVAFALNAATGEELWRFDPEIPGSAQRGLMWWERDGETRLFYTAAHHLIAVDPKTGKAIESFGDSGKVDISLTEREGFMVVTAPGIVFEDTIMLGFSTTEGADALPGRIRAFSTITGEMVWQFNSIPLSGEPGSETWAEGSLEIAGGANTWTGMALDEKRAILYVPTGSATPDFYGASRVGDNLYANCLLAINVRTGELKWHYQMFRHDLWDRDNPAPPTLVQLERDGKTIDGVALTTKSGQLYVFDRDTGESMYPIIEEATLPSTLPGEVVAPTQAVSSISFSRQKFEITTRNEEATAFVAEQIKDWDLRKWAPPKVGTVLFYPWYDGGAEWGGSAFDPNTNRLILNAQDLAGVLTLGEIPVGFSNAAVYARNCASCHGMDLQGSETGPALLGVRERLGYGEIVEMVENGSGRMPSFKHLSDIERRGAVRHIVAPEPFIDEPNTSVDYYLASSYVYLRDHENLPGNSPPWGTLNSIDLATGEIDWQVPFGDYPSNPGLGFGAQNYGGPVVTASGLIFIAATPDRKFRAFDTRDGKILWETELPAAGFTTPAVYSADGKQFVVVAAGGGRMGPPSGSKYFAYSLP